MTFETTVAVVVATAHMTREDGRRLDVLYSDGIRAAVPAYYRITDPCRGAFLEGGWFCTYFGLDDVAAQDLLRVDTGWSRELIAVLTRMREHGFTYVLFDRDGPVLEGLPTFEW